MIENQAIYRFLMLVKNGVLFKIFDQPIENPKTLAKCLKIFNQEIVPGKNQMALKTSQNFDDSKIRQICSESNAKSKIQNFDLLYQIVQSQYFKSSNCILAHLENNQHLEFSKILEPINRKMQGLDKSWMIKLSELTQLSVENF